jgi:D-beta-D-heptose 7-phosphate kinase/D-beta-D-heptose 1-phosphate adenosyltransferase
VIDNNRPTTVKTRVIARNQQMLRIDTEKTQELSSKTRDRLSEYITRVLPTCKATIISDYGKGVISSSLLKKTIDLARHCRVPITVDPKIEHFQRYVNITCMTPNIHEAQAGMHWFRIDSDDAVKKLGARIMKKLHCASLIITRGEQGMDLFQSNKAPVHIPTAAKEVFDVTGAGDTVISVFTMAIACGADYLLAAQISNIAAGSVVGKVGTATVTVPELMGLIKQA